ncbi:MAG: hypothetical protein ACYC3I_12880 [Gemmataceae bacterium]
MSAAFVPSWPGSRVLLGWWRELAGRKPQQVRICRLLLHRVEALVRVRRALPLDRWQRALLSLASAHLPRGGELTNSLSDLRMDAQILGQLVRELAANGLLHQNGAGLWHMTASGRDALETGTLSVAAEERRTFVFVDNSALGRPPHFLPVELSSAGLGEAAAPDAAACSFETASLEACLRQTPEWKARFHFPADAEALYTPQPDETPAANWRRVILDAVEQRLVVFVHTARTSAAPSLLGFSVRPEGWTLEPRALLALADGWEEALPDLAAEPSLDSWRRAWQEWSHPRSLPRAEVEACLLERLEHRLVIHAPPRLIDRLRAARSDAVKQEAWLLAGDGRTRLAAQIELRPL